MLGPVRQFYVYAHRRVTDGGIFYVGKGSGRRAWSRQNRSRHWRFAAAKHGFRPEIIVSHLPEQFALAVEQYVIAVLGLENLANATLGGGGTAGWKHSDEAKRRISAAFKGRVLTERQRSVLDRHRRKKPSAEQRHKMSLAKLGKPRGPMAAETRAKISASHMGMRPTAETLRKLSEAKIGKAMGKDSPSYDHTVRQFTHPVHGIFTGTRAEFIAAYSLGDSCVSAVIKGKQKSVKGWRLK